MKILHITDSHATMKGPESRKDVYYITFLKKMYELAHVIRQEHIDYVIHTGDLFHTPKISDKFAGLIAEMLNIWGVPVYVVPGNHDIEGYNVDTIDQTKLGLLYKTETINLLDRDHPVVFTETICKDEATGECETINVSVSGQEYYDGIDEGNMDDFTMQQEYGNLNILCIHGYVTDEKQHPNIKHTLVDDIVTDADIILSGHFHQQFEAEGEDFSVFNPGSMMRVEQNEYNRTHKPQYGILTIEMEDDCITYDYEFKEFKSAEPSTVIFDYATKNIQKETKVTLENFKQDVTNAAQLLSSGMTLKDALDTVIKTTGADKTLKKMVMDGCTDAVKTIDGDFAAKTGYIENSNVKKHIQSVKIKNFQSHKDTEIEFDKDMNVILGSTNSGKTAIFRAIMWAVGNRPLGNDFITSGEKSCSVKINYSDGTYIERSRTVSGSGKYKVGMYDQNGVFKEETYTGFGSSVPVEVMNIHQMPEVAVTQNISTYLNVMSQLDGPFLLSESPMERAYAIGRIGGTNILDKAISDKSKSISGDKKQIKILDTKMQEKQQDLDKLPDESFIKGVKNALNIISNEANYLSDWIYKASGYMQKISVEDNNASNEHSKLIDLEQKINALETSLKVKDFCKNICDIVTLNDEYELNNAKIESTYDTIKTSKQICAVTKPASLIRTYLQDIKDKNKLLSELNQVSDNIKKVSEMSENAKELEYYMLVLSGRCRNLLNDIFNIQNGINKIKESENLISAAKSKKDTIKTEVKNYFKEIEKQKNERLSLFLKSKTCPCCGQSITKDCVDAITAFIKKL